MLENNDFVMEFTGPDYSTSRMLCDQYLGHNLFSSGWGMDLGLMMYYCTRCQAGFYYMLDALYPESGEALVEEPSLHFRDRARVYFKEQYGWKGHRLFPLRRLFPGGPDASTYVDNPWPKQRLKN